MKNFEIKKPILKPEGEREILPSRIEMIREGSMIINLLIIEGDKRVDLAEFLPEGVDFSENEEIGFLYQNVSPPFKGVRPTVIFPATELNAPDGRVALLHEIGHAMDAARNNYKMPFSDEIRRIDILISSLRKTKEYGELQDKESRNKYIIEKFNGSELDMTEEDVVEAIKQLAHNERSAWNCATEVIKKINEKGVAFLGSNCKEKFLESMKQTLDSYEQLYGFLASKGKYNLFISEHEFDDINT